LEYPPLTILLVTYDRPKEIRRTINALLDSVYYPGRIRLHIADDGSPGDYVNDLLEEYEEARFSFSATITDRGGWGKNYNNAFRDIDTDYIFVIEDDYVAKKGINLCQGVALMEMRKDIALVRYDGVGGHKLTLELRSEPWDSPHGGPHLHYMVIDQDNSELYAYSNRPHLIHRRFHTHFGYYAEGRQLGETEESFGHTVKNLAHDGYRLAVLEDGIPCAFDHIGHSYQLTEMDNPQ